MREFRVHAARRAQTRKSPARRIGTPIPGPGRIGNRGFPPRFPAKKSGNRGDRESDFLSDEYQLQWTRNILSREYHASAFTGSWYAAPIQGPRQSDSEREHAAVSVRRASTAVNSACTQPRVSCSDRQHAAPIDSGSDSERGNMSLSLNGTSRDAPAKDRRERISMSSGSLLWTCLGIKVWVDNGLDIVRKVRPIVRHLIIILHQRSLTF